MANRYWVGGTDYWNGIAGTKWAETSGGAGGASVPTSSDDVFFDANSGSVTVTTYSNLNCNNFDCTGFSGTLTGASLITIHSNNFILWSGMAMSGSVGFYISSSSGTINLYTNGVSISGELTLGTSSSSDSTIYNLTSDLVCFEGFILNHGIFNTNNYNLTVGKFGGWLF